MIALSKRDVAELPDNSNAEISPPALSRVARKRLETRGRIIDAARDLMRGGRVDEVTIQDITSAADVGHGTFYLHFKSKHEVLLPILVAEAAAMDATLQASLANVSDSAEILGLSARFMGYAIVQDDLWRWFLNHSGLPGEDLRQAFGAFSERDFNAGLASGRFKVADPRVAAVFGFGGFVSVLMASFDAPDPHTMIDQAVVSLLCVLGVSTNDAAAIANQSIQHIR